MRATLNPSRTHGAFMDPRAQQRRRILRRLRPPVPAVMMAAPMLAICLILHLSTTTTPALVTDLLAFGLAALADRWLAECGNS